MYFISVPMNLLLNGAFMLGLVYITSGIIAIGMAIYFIELQGNGLKSILYHLFFSWAGHYLVIGGVTLASFLTGKELMPLNNLRLVAAFFVLLQFSALVRLCFYIIKKK